ncbi:hypothetical protein [Asticcacaulis sp. AC402]|uniref:hypothetical protein n=1 Tax=Asticcacaulis sp. AC402 TaxID=1282361 RepID=UPI0003C3E07F|nr:hypothetical protein [Asticcacaulis sp. AC402]ESQ75646.1 hypothetical protein ABAC402_08965 [Asticcacaulis sp. AC402]
MTFAKTYKFTTSSRFRKILQVGGKKVGKGKARWLAIGGKAGAGLVSWLGQDGVLLTSKTYKLQFPFVFVDGVVTDKGDFLLLGGVGPSPDDMRYSGFVLLRIDAGGVVLWSKRLSPKGWSSWGRVIRGPGKTERYLVVFWYALAGNKGVAQQAELILLDGSGVQKRAGRFELPDAWARMYDIFVKGDGYVIVGDYQSASCPAPSPWASASDVIDYQALGNSGMVLFLAADLATKALWSVNSESDGPGFSLRTGLSTDYPFEFLVSGCIGTDWVGGRGTLLAVLPFDGVSEGMEGNVFSLADPAVQPISLQSCGNDFFIFSAALPLSAFNSATALRVTPAGDTYLGSALTGYWGQSYVAKIRIGFQFDQAASVLDLRVSIDQTVQAAGSTYSKTDHSDSWMLATDSALECCRTVNLELPTHTKMIPSISPIDLRPGTTKEIKTAPFHAEIVNVNVAVQSDFAKTASLCGVSLERKGERKLQSPDLNLRTAGSDGTEASHGILLRWFLTGALSNHLPQGNNATVVSGFNRPDDFVTLYRAKWPSVLPKLTLDLMTANPSYVDTSNPTVFFCAGPGANAQVFGVRFLDQAAFDAASTTSDPMTNFTSFLAAYGSQPLEIELRNSIAIACDVTIQGFGSQSIDIETHSVGENRPSAPRTVSSRRTLTATDGPTVRLFAENIRAIRVRATSGLASSFAFTIYDDVLADIDARSAWTQLGRFALTTVQNEAFKRLEDPSRFQVDGLWRKFNDGAFVKVDNYKDRWTTPTDGLGAAVQIYLQLSQSDPMANRSVVSNDPDNGLITLSYLELLQLASLDYHVARMLGLGYVDDQIVAGNDYVHMAEYRTVADLGDGKGPRPVQHLYIGLPTNLSQSRLPLVPDLDSVGYGLTVPTGSGVPYALTDSAGYTPDGTVRFIRLNPGCVPLYTPGQSFFQPSFNFDLSMASLPVTYGVEYRKQGEAVWRKPEIAHDPTYKDTSNPAQFEILTTPFPGAQFDRAFIHAETEAGIHEYAVFGVNVFSRPSNLSPVQATDTTVFKRRNTLLPPTDIQTQFIQAEAVLTLTTSDEQDLLPPLVQAGDASLVRVCFNYGMAHDDAYGFNDGATHVFADTIEFVHRQNLPRNVNGAVGVVGTLADAGQASLACVPYTYSNGQTASPALSAALKSNFIGGVVVAGGQRLVIEDIQWPDPNSDANPVFIVRKDVTSGAINNSGVNTLIRQNVPVAAAPGDLMMAIENMASASSWGFTTTNSPNPLTAKVQIGGTGWSYYTEDFTRSDNSSVTRYLRGIWEQAIIAPSLVPTTPPHYTISFTTFKLDPHPQAGEPNPVSWWKGHARASVFGRDLDDRRSLKVLQIATDASGYLVLHVIDDSGEADHILTDPSTSILVNYYPGYKVYLKAETAAAFDKNSLLPATGEGSRTTLLGLRSKDSTTLDTTSHAYCSNIGVPQLVTALEVIAPMRPRQPSGPNYATPPDSRGVASYTMSLTFEHEPFAAVVYRADALSILGALYSNTKDAVTNSSTLDLVRAVVFPDGGDVWVRDRFKNLFDFITGTDSLTAFPPLPDTTGYIFPMPDAESAFVTNGAADTASIQAALFRAFVPLTEQPLFYSQIRQDSSYVPHNGPQVFRDANGDLLAPGKPGFDLAPMAKRPSSNDANAIANSFQFTDFTLDGSMNAKTLYFYTAREIGNRMLLGNFSVISPPVKLVNLTPPAAPVLRKIRFIPFEPASGTNPQVTFAILAPRAVDPMETLRIYRSKNHGDAQSLRTMQLVKDVPVASLGANADGTVNTDDTVIVFDDFADDIAVDGYPPYGDDLFYRLAWTRKVTYEDKTQAVVMTLVVSEPTRILQTSIIDVVNPEAPTPVVSLSPAQDGYKLVHLAWNRTVHNGKYYVFRMNAQGNWLLVGTVVSNALSLSMDLPEALPVYDVENNLIYYRFKVDVEGASGLVNIVSAPVIISLHSS